MGAGSSVDAGTQQLLQQQCQAVLQTCSRVDVNTKATVINSLAVNMGLQCGQITVAQAQQPMMQQGQMMQGQPMMQQGQPMQQQQQQQQQQQGGSGYSTGAMVGGAVLAGGAGAGIMYGAQTGAFDNVDDGLASAGGAIMEGAGDAGNFIADGAGDVAEGASSAIGA